MGGHVRNLHVKSDDVRGIAKAVARATWGKSYVTDALHGWVTVAPVLGMDVLELARALSASRGTVAVGVDLYDGEVCRVGAFRQGKRLFRATQAEPHSEYADVLTEEPGVTILRGKGKHAERTRLQGQFGKLARHIGVPATDVEQALHPRHVAAEDVPTALGSVLGLPRERAWFSFPWKPSKSSLRNAKLVRGTQAAPEPASTEHEETWTAESVCANEPPAAIIHPRRDRAVAYIFPDAEAAWASVRALKAWRQSPRYGVTEPLREAARAALAKLESTAVPSRGTLDEDALVLWFAGRAHQKSDAWFLEHRQETMTLSYLHEAGHIERLVEPTAFDGIVDAWVGAYGATEALLRVVASMAIEPTFPAEMQPGILARATEPWVTVQKSPLYRVRRHLSLVNDDEFGRARDAVRAAFASWSPLQQLAAAYAIAIDAELANRAGEAVVASSSTYGAAPILARGCVTDPALVESLCMLPSNSAPQSSGPPFVCNAKWELGADRPSDDELGILTLVSAIGQGAVRLVERYRNGIHRTVDDPVRPSFVSRV
jgi:hypothetical protein